MADEIKKVISVDVSDSINKVKSLKKEVEDLQKVFDKPMKLNVSGIQEQLKNIQKSLSNVTDGLKTSDLSGKMDEIRNLGTAIANSLEVVKKSINESLNVSDLSSKLDTIISLIERFTSVIKTDVTTSLTDVKNVVVETREEMAKPFTIELGNSPTTVKDLKNEINTLKDALLNLEAGTDDYNKVVERLVQDQTRLNEVVNAGKSNASAAEGSYNALKNEMKALQDVWKTVTDEQTRADLGNRIREINDQLKELDASIGNHQRNVGNYAGAFKDLRQEIQEARDVMAGAIPGSEEYAAAAQRAADAMDKLNDIQKLAREGASGLDNKFAVTANVMGSLSGGFTAAQGVMALFGAESENLQKTMVKLQAAMSITGGLKALATLPKSLKSAQVAFGGVTKGVNTFIKSLKGVKAAIAATGIGLLVVLLGELIANWESVTEWIEKTIGSLDQLKEVVMGVYNVIKTFLIAPFRAIGQLVKGNFSEAADAMKEAFDVAGNYAKGVEEQATRNAEKESQKRMAQYDKEKDEYIKDNEAKYGSDWKYTKEGQKAYREMFENRLKMYKKDSDEYKAAQRGLWSFERGLAERRGKTTKTTSEERKKLEEKALENIANARTKAEDLIRTSTQKIDKEYRDTLTNLKAEVDNVFSVAPLKEYNDRLIANAKDDYVELKDFIKTVFDDGKISNLEDAMGFNGIEKRSEIIFNELKSELEKAEGWTEEYSQILDDVFTSPEIAINLLIKALEDGDTAVVNFFRNLYEEGLKNTSDSLNLTMNDFDMFTRAVASAYKSRNNEIEAEQESSAEKLLKVQEKAQQMSLEAYNSFLDETIADLENADIQRQWYDIFEDFDSNSLKVFKDASGSILDIIGIPGDFVEYQKFFDDILNAETSYFDKRRAVLEKAGEDYGSTIDRNRGNLLNFFSWRRNEDDNDTALQIANNNTYLLAFQTSIDKQIELIREQMEIENISAETRMELENRVAQLEQDKATETYEVWKKNKQLELAEFKRVEQGKKQLVSQTADLSASLSEWSSEMSTYWTKKAEEEEGKAKEDALKKSVKYAEYAKGLSIASTVISTWQSAQESYQSLAGIPYVGPALGAVAAATAIASGIARVTSIMNQDVTGKSSNLSQGQAKTTSAVAVPNVDTNPYQYTRNITTAEEEDMYNRPIEVKAYISETDLQESEDRRQSRKNETTF